MSKNNELSKQSDLDLIFSDVETSEEYVSYDLPSKGRLYSDGKTTVQLRPITFEDEKLLVTSKTENPVNLLLSRCVKGIDYKNLVLLDRLGIFLKLRQISFGDDYKINVSCQNCEAPSEVDISISDFPINELPEDMTEPREVTLPEVKRIFIIKTPRVKDEGYLEDINTIHASLWRFVDKIQIKDERYSEDKTLIAKVIEKLPRRDVHFLISKIMLAEYGYQTRFLFGCPHCKTEKLMEAPLDADFFTENLNTI